MGLIFGLPGVWALPPWANSFTIFVLLQLHFFIIKIFKPYPRIGVFWKIAYPIRIVSDTRTRICAG
jgi:hypothetical protein